MIEDVRVRVHKLVQGALASVREVLLPPVTARLWRGVQHGACRGGVTKTAARLILNLGTHGHPRRSRDR